MALCPKCRAPGAYIGFSSIECRNKKCEHFVLAEDTTCPCCRGPYHDDGEPCPGPDGSAYGPGRGMGNGRRFDPPPSKPGDGLTAPNKEPSP